MSHIQRLFSQQDREAVNRAVQQAETETSAEIVPVVAAESGRYDRAEDVVGLWTALLALCVVWAVFPQPAPTPGDWAAPAAVWQLAALAAAVVAGFVIGAFLGSRWDGLRRLFTPRRQMREEVFSRAREVFFDHRVHHTQTASGVLLYVSLFEHMAAVIADQSVLEKLGQDQIDQWCAAFTERLQHQTATEALCETARVVGKTLGPVLPRAAGDVNELADALVVME